MGKIIVITGTSASGKSSLAKKVSSGYGFPVVGVSAFCEEIAKQRGFSDLDSFESEVGLRKSYFALIPNLLEHIKMLNSSNGGVVVEGVYNPELYSKIKDIARGQSFLFLLGAARSTRKNRLRLREGLDSASAKRGLHVRRVNKKMKGLNAMLTHPDAIPLGRAGFNSQMKIIQNALNGRVVSSQGLARRTMRHLKEKKIALQRLFDSKRGKVKYRSARKK